MGKSPGFCLVLMLSVVFSAAGQDSVSAIIKFRNVVDFHQVPSLPSDPILRSKAVAQFAEAQTQKFLNLKFPELKVDPLNGVEEVTPLWIANAVRVKASPAVIEKLVSHRSVSTVEIETLKPIDVRPETGGTLVSSRLANGALGWGVQKIGADTAWEQGVMGSGVIVAVIDSGVNISHPDLAPNIWVNTGEVGKDSFGNNKETNGIDDDKNGFVDDVNGWNFEEDTNDISDLKGHGTQAAGIVAGMGAGGRQTGVAPSAKIMALRACCSLDGQIAESAIWQALQYAVKNGARVISMSLSVKHFGKPSYEQWRKAGEFLNAAGVVHVNSAGNRGGGNEPFNIGAPGSNPPAWLHPLQQVGSPDLSSMIAVGAVDEDDKPRFYSGVGPVTWESIDPYKDFPYASGKKPGLLKPDICAPSETPSLSMDGVSYTSAFGGTSSATPHVAGVVALLLSYAPKLSVAQITEALQMSALSLGAFDNRCGAGRIQVSQALIYIREHF